MLLWIVLVYLWGVQWASMIREQVKPDVLFLFTVLMLLHFSLYIGSSIRPLLSQRGQLFTERTVKTYLSSIYSKLGVDSRASAVAKAIGSGLLSPNGGEW